MKGVADEMDVDAEATRSLQEKLSLPSMLSCLEPDAIGTYVTDAYVMKCS